jgi:predicted AAA+ superfamily ATPase
MRRIIDYYLKQWRESVNRKPLLLRGARQTGKTHSVRQLGQTFKSYVEINFEKIAAREVFSKDLDPQRILRELELLTGKRITPKETLLFLDEVQVVPEAITALRYFYEDMPDLHIIAAGSLVDFAIESISMPVGRISFLYMRPMSFLEFLKALKEELLLEEIINHNFTVPLAEPIHRKLLDYLGIYVGVGGMPEAVKCWIDTQTIANCSKVQQELIGAYRQDFQKYSKTAQLKYVEFLFNQVPRYLGKSIKFQRLSETYRKRELAPCLELLEKANIICKVTHTAGNGIPLGAEIVPEKFKLVFLDIALCLAILGADLKEWFLQPAQTFINKGEITESLIGQELLAYKDPRQHAELYYWHREARGSNAEVDYLVQVQENIAPIEVKSKLGGGLKSLHLFLQTHVQVSYGIRFSMHNYSTYEKIRSYPLYAVAGALAEDKAALLSLIDTT